MKKEYGKMKGKMKIKKFKNKKQKDKGKPDAVVEFEEKGGNRRAHRVERGKNKGDPNE